MVPPQLRGSFFSVCARVLLCRQLPDFGESCVSSREYPRELVVLFCLSRAVDVCALRW